MACFDSSSEGSKENKSALQVTLASPTRSSPPLRRAHHSSDDQTFVSLDQAPRSRFQSCQRRFSVEPSPTSNQSISQSSPASFSPIHPSQSTVISRSRLSSVERVSSPTPPPLLVHCLSRSCARPRSLSQFHGARPLRPPLTPPKRPKVVRRLSPQGEKNTHTSTYLTFRLITVCHKGLPLLQLVSL